jgi:hypothetical protein
LQNGTDVLASIRNCKTPEVRFRAMLTEKTSDVQLVRS